MSIKLMLFWEFKRNIRYKTIHPKTKVNPAIQAKYKETIQLKVKQPSGILLRILFSLLSEKTSLIDPARIRTWYTLIRSRADALPIGPWGQTCISNYFQRSLLRRVVSQNQNDKTILVCNGKRKPGSDPPIRSQMPLQVFIRIIIQRFCVYKQIFSPFLFSKILVFQATLKFKFK